MTVDDFLTRHGGDTFRHSAELLPAIRSGACLLHSTTDPADPVRCRELLNICDRRIKHLSNRNTLHATELRADLELLVAELQQHSEEFCVMWIFNLEPYYSFCIFEVLETQHILGCDRGVDDRLIGKEERETLWGASA